MYKTEVIKIYGKRKRLVYMRADQTEDPQISFDFRENLQDTIWTPLLFQVPVTPNSDWSNYRITVFAA